MHNIRRNKAAVHARAKQLNARGQTEKLADLALHLNALSLTSSAGTPYKPGGRGVARLVSTTYHYVAVELGLGDSARRPSRKLSRTETVVSRTNNKAAAGGRASARPPLLFGRSGASESELATRPTAATTSATSTSPSATCRLSG